MTTFSTTKSQIYRWLRLSCGVACCDEGGLEAPLLAIAPLLDEGDLSSASHFEFIAATLRVFEKSTDSIAFLVADNENRNRCLASTFLQVPMIGCASHRLNLAVREHLHPYDSLLRKINELMKKLGNLKKSAALRTKTPLRPIKRCQTRWSGDFMMLLRYEQLVPHIDPTGLDLVEFLPSAVESLCITELLQNLKKFESVNRKLQEEKINMLKVRVLFDSLVNDFPSTESALSAQADIVESKDFENAIVKCIRGEEHALSIREKESIKFLEEGVQEVDAGVSTSYAEQMLAAKLPKLVKYGHLDWLPPTSNMLERLFSRAKITSSPLRNRMTPLHMEESLFLYINKHFGMSILYLRLLMRILNKVLILKKIVFFLQQ